MIEPRGILSEKTPPNIRKQIPTTRTNLDLTNIDHAPSSVTHSDSNAMLYVFEVNEAVIKMIIKGRSPTMRHVSRTHRVALDWLFDRINLDSKILIRYIDTTHQLETIWPKVISHVTNGSIFFICSLSTISALLDAPRIPAWQAALNRWRRGCRNRREKKELWQNRNLQRWACLHMFRQVPQPRKFRLHLKARGHS